VENNLLSSGLMFVFVSVDVWRSFVSCQIGHVKRHWFGEQTAVWIVCFAKDTSI
jgi:hypothetical protein